jgi:hypothetical protein
MSLGQRLSDLGEALVNSRREWNKTARYSPDIAKGPLIQPLKARDSGAPPSQGAEESPKESNCQRSHNRGVDSIHTAIIIGLAQAPLRKRHHLRTQLPDLPETGLGRRRFNSRSRLTVAA